MTLNKKPFVRYHEEKKSDSFTVVLNAEERALVERSKSIIEQKKDSTALKQLAWIGAKTIGDEKIRYILSTIFKNKRKNARLGIIEFE